MTAKSSWHKYGMKLRHCHPVWRNTAFSRQTQYFRMLVLTFWCHSGARLRLFCFGYGPQNRAITHEFAERRAVPTNAPRKQYPLQSRPTDRIIIISLLQRRSSDVTILWLTNPRKGRCWRSDIGHTITNYDIRHLFADMRALTTGRLTQYNTRW